MPSLKYRLLSPYIIELLNLITAYILGFRAHEVPIRNYSSLDIRMIPAGKYSSAGNNYSIKARILVTLHPHTGSAYHY